MMVSEGIYAKDVLDSAVKGTLGDLLGKIAKENAKPMGVKLDGTC